MIDQQERRGVPALGDRPTRPGAERRTLNIRVYLYPREGRWVAEATGLALMAEGASREEAFQCVLEQVAAYVRTAVARGWEDRLSRSVSLRHRLYLQFRVALSRLTSRPGLIRNKLVSI
jgi:hypothetical protein